MTKKFKEKFNIDAAEDKMLKKLMWRTMSLSLTYNYERMQGLGYVYAMIPVIKHFYKTEEERREGYVRHFEIFNTTPSVAGFITGLSAAMEKEASKDPNFDRSSINAVKVSLMGPFAGIGDTIFQAALRVITLSIGISLCMQGNFFGVILHGILYNIVGFLSRFWGPYISYGYGTSFMSKATEGGMLGHITKAVSIVGLMAVGAMTSTMVKVRIAAEPVIAGGTIKIQELIDGLFPNLLPLALTFFCFWLVTKKNVKTIWIMLVMIILGVVGKYFGVL